MRVYQTPSRLPSAHGIDEQCGFGALSLFYKFPIPVSFTTVAGSDYGTCHYSLPTLRRQDDGGYSVWQVPADVDQRFRVVLHGSNASHRAVKKYHLGLIIHNVTHTIFISALTDNFLTTTTYKQHT